MATADLEAETDARLATLVGAIKPKNIWMKRIAQFSAISLAVFAVVVCLALPRSQDDTKKVSEPTPELANFAEDTGGLTTTYQPGGPSPKIFCWSRMQDGGYEVPLVKMQFIRQASLFACNGFAVISDKKVKLGKLNDEIHYTWVNQVPDVPMGKNGVDGQTTDSFLNTEVFLLAWDTLIHGGLIWSFDFVVKVDPDAVFFPDRLRGHVKDHVGEMVYFANCGKWGPNTLLYGSLEVFSKEAIALYAARRKECQDLDWQGWGEDYYMQQCMDHLGVGKVPDTDQVADDRCIGAPCSDWTKVAFHDFKDPEDWYRCFKEAIGEGEHPADNDVEVLIRKK